MNQNRFGFFAKAITTTFAFALLMLLSLNPAAADDQPNKSESDYQEIKWVDLIPVEDLAALLNPPQAIDRIADGSAEDSLDNTAAQAAGDSRYFQALNSQNIVEKFDNQKIRIPGFIVPIESDDKQRITSFFLVPYFGACLHLPPPPPNQIIYAKYPKGFLAEVLYDPFWVEGTVKTELVDTMLGTSAYVMDIDRIKDYEE